VILELMTPVTREMRFCMRDGHWVEEMTFMACPSSGMATLLCVSMWK
jgi:hypothetical protein